MITVPSWVRVKQKTNDCHRWWNFMTTCKKVVDDGLNHVVNWLCINTWNPTGKNSKCHQVGNLTIIVWHHVIYLWYRLWSQARKQKYLHTMYHVYFGLIGKITNLNTRKHVSKVKRNLLPPFTMHCYVAANGTCAYFKHANINLANIVIFYLDNSFWQLLDFRSSHACIMIQVWDDLNHDHMYKFIHKVYYYIPRRFSLYILYHYR